LGDPAQKNVVYPRIHGYNLKHGRRALEYESPKKQVQAGGYLMNGQAMDRRAFLKMAAAATAAMAIPGCGRQEPSRKPNVLFVFDDQLRADVCGVYGGGNIATPYIDRLAAQGATFTNSVSSCPLCTPYRGMVQTGR
jgi:hypothetical protein